MNINNIIFTNLVCTLMSTLLRNEKLQNKKNVYI